MEEESEKQDFRLELAQQVFLYRSSDVPGVDRPKLQTRILDSVYSNGLAPYYQHICTELGWQVDQAKLSEMQSRNQKQLEELDAKFKDAEENLGETEVRDALHAKAEFYGRIGDRDAATKAYKDAEEKTASGASKADMVFSQVRLAILYQDWLCVKKLLGQAKAICEAGGDWEHKNKLKVYEGVAALHSRDFKRAAEQLLDSIATFTTSELFSYTECVSYAVIASLLSLDRVSLKSKVVDSPEIRSVIGHVPALETCLNALYDCSYKDFFRSFLGVVDIIRADMYLHPHVRHYMRELRLVAYNQFLDSYKSVTMDSMATAFDVSVPFLDSEVADFICAGRISAKIDKVAGIIETKRPDAKNALYLETIKRGDLLLNRVQKLSRVVDVE
eukprot:GHRR01005117.1.p1 GENE.GHRR01005117.1~~GHRR01005117.1.p1  ORF type:complete len:388 (+),score=142.07 GHRR01005117.1:202-1365(+)